MFAKEDDTSSILQAENSFPWYYLANDARFMAIIVMIFPPFFFDVRHSLYLFSAITMFGILIFEVS